MAGGASGGRGGIHAAWLRGGGASLSSPRFHVLRDPARTAADRRDRSRQVPWLGAARRPNGERISTPGSTSYGGAAPPLPVLRSRRALASPRPTRRTRYPLRAAER